MIFAITSGSSMLAMTRTCPPQSSQVCFALVVSG